MPRKTVKGTTENLNILNNKIKFKCHYVQFAKVRRIK